MSLSPSCMAAVESALGYSSPKSKEEDTKVLKLELLNGGMQPKQILRIFGIPYVASSYVANSWEAYKTSQGEDGTMRATWENQSIVFERIISKKGPVKVDKLHILVPACKLDSFTFLFRFCLNNIPIYDKIVCVRSLVFKGVSKGNDPQEYCDQWQLAIDGDYCKLMI